MADAGIKKVTVLNEDLPIINSEIAGYGVRYRIVSEDRNRVSHWSPVYFLDAQYTYVAGQIKFAKTSDVVTATWDKVEIKRGDTSLGKVRDYEVWIKWGKAGNGDWIYDGKSQTNTTNFIIPDTYFIDGVDQEEKPNQLTVEIFLESVPVSRTNTSLRMYNPSTQTV